MLNNLANKISTKYGVGQFTLQVVTIERLFNVGMVGMITILTRVLLCLCSEKSRSVIKCSGGRERPLDRTSRNEDNKLPL